MARLWLCMLGMVLVVSAQDRGAAIEEVRVRSAIYSPPGLSLSVQTNLVELLVMVRDAQDRAIGGLRKEDFEVFDRGVRQTISVFAANDAAKAAKASGAERYLALYFDDTHAGAGTMANARTAAAQFVQSGMLPGDHIGIFTTSGAVIVDFTKDRQALTAALARLVPRPVGVRGVSGCPELNEFEAYAIAHNLDTAIKANATARAIACNCPADSDPGCPARQPFVVQTTAEMLWDQVRLPAALSMEVLDLVVRHLARAPGQRMLLMLSSGLLLDRIQQQTSATVDTAVRAQIAIHGIDAFGLRTGLGTGAWQLVLEETMSNLASATGGRVIHNANDFAGAMRTVTAAPENSYIIGFSPAREPDDKFHPLKVRLTNGGSERIETRPGYFASTTKKKESVQQRLDRIAASQERIDEFPTVVRVTQGEGIKVEIQVDAKALKFAQQAGRSVQQLTFVTVLEDESGAYITGRQSVMDLILTPEKLAELKRDGIKAGLVFQVPKGNYRVREVVREAAQNRIAAGTTGVMDTSR